MAKFTGGRPGFRDWLDKQSDPGWDPLPLTHIAKTIIAEDIVWSDCIRPIKDEVFDEPAAYLFYGRPAYRVSGDGSIKIEAACPFCFVFDSALANTASGIYAFDTVAFSKRMYSRIIMEEMPVDDFSLGTDFRRANRLINCVFRTKDSYLQGDLTNAETLQVDPWEFHARAYLDLITSPGRNEPDDRVCAIEFVFNRQIPLSGGVRAVIVPHTLWGSQRAAPWIKELAAKKVEISTYEFIPGRHPDYYCALLETQIRNLYNRWGVL
jgi:hypothetical protein